MIFKKLRFKNFLSYGNNITEFDLDSNLLTSIVGENGHGKSVFCDAIFFGLTGYPYRNINKPQLLNSTNKKDCLVEIELIHKGSNYLIRRGINPNIFEIFKDKKLINESSSLTDYQLVLEESLGYTRKTLKQTLIMSSRYYIPFLQLPAAEKRDFIENVFSIKMFAHMCDDLKKRITSLMQEESLLAKDIIRVESNIKIIEDFSKTTKETIEKEKENLKIEIDKLNNENLEIESKILENDKRRDTINKKIEEYEEILNKLNKAQNQFVKINHEISNIKNKIKFFDTNKICPECTQEISHEFRIEKIEKENLLIEQYNQKLNDIEKALEKLKIINERISNANKLITDTIRENSSLKTTIQINKNSILEKSKKSNELHIKNDVHNEQIDIFIEQKKNIENRLQEIKNEKYYSEVLIKMLSEKGIRKFIISKYIPILNKLVNEYLQMFDAQYQILFNDEVQEKIIARGYEDLSYNSFSSGEKQRLDLALLFSFLELSRIKNSLDTNLIIFDEVLDASLDDSGIAGVFKIFYDLKSKGYTLYVVSHRGIADQFEQSYNVTKKRFSEVEKI